MPRTARSSSPPGGRAYGRRREDSAPDSPQMDRPAEATRADQPGARPSRRGARGGDAEPDRRRDHALLRLDGVRLPPRDLVRELDRLRRREVPLRPADDDRVARGDLPVDVRDDQPEPRRREAPGDRRPAVDDGAGGGPSEPRAARPQQADP